MKLFLAALLFVGATTSIAHADSCKNICPTFFNESKKVSCITTVSNGYFDDTACNVCATFFNEEKKLQCIGGVRNKTYDSYTVNTCAGLFSEAKKLECLAGAGTPYNQRTNNNGNRGSSCDLAALSRKVDGAIINFNNRNYQDLGNTLVNMKKLLSGCGY